MLDYGNTFGFVGSRRSATILKFVEIFDFGEKLIYLKFSIFLEPNLCEKCSIMEISLVFVGSRRSATILKLDEIFDFCEKHDISEIFDFAWSKPISPGKMGRFAQKYGTLFNGVFLLGKPF